MQFRGGPPHTPLKLLARNFPPQLTHPKAGSPTPAGAFLPPGLGLGSRGGRGAAQEKVARELCLGKVGGTGGGAGPDTGQREGGSDGDSWREDFFVCVVFFCFALAKER